MRTFRYSDDKSYKFWNIDVHGTGFTVTYGKIGTAGQTSTKEYPTAEKALAEADKLVREKTGKGYVETTPKKSMSEAEAYETAILNNPADTLAWSVYADHLAEAGDVRGEFMQVQLALEDENVSAVERKKLAAREKELLAAHEAEWLGTLADAAFHAAPTDHYRNDKMVKQRSVVATFERGWPRRLEFVSLKVNHARAYAKCPEARFVTDLLVESTEYEQEFEPGSDVPDEADEGDVSMHALCHVPYLANVRKFHLGEADEDQEYFNCHISGELAYHVVKQMPAIEELRLLAHRVDANKIFPLKMPNLRVLVLFHSNRYPLDKLAANESLANLEVIRCHPHALDYDEEEPGAYIKLKHLKAICRAPQFIKLRHLCLRLTDFGDAGAKEIVDSGVLKKLKVLDLQGGNISDKGAKLLAASPDFAKLEYVNLKSNALTQEGIDAIAKTKVKCDASGQHEVAEFGDGETPEYLFEGDIE